MSWSVSVASVQGRRRTMEDTHLCHQFPSGTQLVAVFDGHSGSRVAEFAQANLISRLNWPQEETPQNIKTAMTEAFLQIDAMLREQYLFLFSPTAGSTANVVVATQTHLVCINLGDSRAVLLTTDEDGDDYVVPLSTDHKPNLPEEKARIEAAGGVVLYPHGYCPRVDGTLAVSRALGDFEFKTPIESPPELQKVTAVPEVFAWEQTLADKQIVVATDGLWDVVSNDDAMTMTTPEHLIERATQKGSQDNITVIVLKK